MLDRFGQGDLAARAAINRKDELGQLASSFNQMADRIQTLLAAERRLLLDISHELRSPLARLGVAVELARSGEDRDHMLDRIQKEADRLNELVAELLQVTRVEGDPSMQKTETVPLDELLADIVYDSLLEAKAKDCTLLLKAPVAVTLSGDEELIRRAVENVIRNAIRYAPHGTPIDIELKKSGGMAEICVRDYGPGVPADALPRIFDPFYRVDSDRNRVKRRPGIGTRHRPPVSGVAQGETHGAERQSGIAGGHRTAARAGIAQGGTENGYSGFSSLMSDGSSNRLPCTLGSLNFTASANISKTFSPFRCALHGEWPLNAIHFAILRKNA